jgi:glycosyltransferase involved in cell wall biosynthesis
MHVAQFVQRYPPALGGSEAYIARLCEYLADCGDDVRVWTTTAIELEELWKHSPASRERQRPEKAPPVADAPGSSGVSVVRYRPACFPSRRYALKALSLLPFRPLQTLMLPCNPVCPAMWRDAGQYAGPLDAVHATAFPYSFPIACALRLARRRGVPLLLTPFLHLGDPADPHDRTRRQYTRPCLRWLLRQADRVFVQTPSEYRSAVELGAPEERVVLQGLGVDPAECTGGDREAARRHWGVESGTVVIGHLANNSVEKGTVDLLKAAAIAVGRGHPVRVLLAGPEMPNFRRFWEDYPKEDLVTRLGVISDEQKRAFFAGIDVFALPSRSDSFGLVLLEAWANGMPVVAYRAGGPADLIRDGEDGLLIPCGELDGLAGALGQLAAGRAFRGQLGDAGRRRVRAEFRWADKLGLVREVLLTLTARREPFGSGPALRGGPKHGYAYADRSV